MDFYAFYNMDHVVLSCNKCGTRYCVELKAIGDLGRSVKCASCGNVWFQESVDIKSTDIIKSAC